MDDRSQERFDHLRDLHFPPERNYLSAHLTLFHKLPGEHEAEISDDLQEVCLDQTPLTLIATGLRSLGRGVAYDLRSPGLSALRRELARRWEPWLGAQDRQGFKPHMSPYRTRSRPSRRGPCSSNSRGPSRRTRSRGLASRCGATSAALGSRRASTFSHRDRGRTVPDPESSNQQFLELELPSRPPERRQPRSLLHLRQRRERPAAGEQVQARASSHEERTLREPTL